MSDYQEVITWRDLLQFLQQASREQLDQPVQVAKQHPVDEYVYPLLPAVCVGSVDQMNLRYVRSSVDNRRHGEEIILFVDSHPFGVDGAVAYESISPHNHKPIYAKDHTADQDWTGPAQEIADKLERVRGPGTLIAILKNRTGDMSQ